MPYVPRVRRGAALAVALFALVAIAALVHAVIAPAIGHRAAMARSLAHHAAQSYAERAVGEVVSAWSPERWRALAVGDAWEGRHEPAVGLPGAPPGAATVQVSAVRIARSTFLLLVQATVRAADAPAAARRALFLEQLPDSAAAALLTAGGGVAMSPAGVIEADPACGGADTSALIRLPPGAPFSWDRPDAIAHVRRDTLAAQDDVYRRPAGLDAATLRHAAAIEIAADAAVAPVPRALGADCALGESHWGEPMRDPDEGVPECRPSYPVVRAAGDLRILGGRGQGILLVEGRLEIAGRFRFEGLIVAAGGIEAGGDSVHLHGAVLTGPASPAAFSAARTTLVASPCAVQRAFDANAPIRPIRGWAWAG